MTPEGRRIRRRVLFRIPVLLLLLLVTSVALSHGHRWFGPPPPPEVLRIGAGHTRSDTFAIISALEDLAKERNHAQSLEVVATTGSLDNVRLLESGDLHLATVQADTPLPASLRVVGTLHSDAFLMVVRADSPLTDLVDLIGSSIVTGPAGSAQAISLQRILDHYELLDLVTVRHEEVETADDLLLNGTVDALFRVRSIHNANLQTLADQHPLRLLPIEQGQALHATDPSLHPVVLPRGVLHGRPPMPADATPTVEVQRLLVTHQDLPSETIRALAHLMFENRYTLIQRTPVASGLSPPSRTIANPALLHAGVDDWLDRSKPSYLQQNVDYVSFLISTFVLLGSWALAGRSYLSRRMRKRADHHHHVLLGMLRAIDAAADPSELDALKEGLFQLLAEALDDVESEAISSVHFQGFTLGWQAAHRTLQARYVAMVPPLPQSR